MERYLQCHAGRPAVVVGGAPSRVLEIGCCPDGAVWISANDHGCRARRCDYIACVDKRDATEARIRAWGLPVIGALMAARWADIVVGERRLHNSAALGAYAAWRMGCAPVIVIGVECYQGGTYAHDALAPSSGRKLTLDQHLAQWRLLRAAAPGADIRAVGGPLLTLFPQWRGRFNPINQINQKQREECAA